MHLETKPGSLARAGTTAMTSALRCFRVLELLAQEPFELGISELAAMLSLPKASLHRIATTLIQGGLIERDSATRCYRLSPKALWIGSGYLRHSSVYRAAFFPMRELARQLPGSVQLGVLDSGKILFIHAIGDPGSPDLFADVGLCRPLHATASGKVYLAEMLPEEVERLMASNLEKYTSQTIVSASVMAKELLAVSKNGYAVNREELIPGYSVLAAAVLNREGRVAGAISATLSSMHLEDDKETRYATLVRQAANQTSRQLGYHPRQGVARMGDREVARGPGGPPH